jgi:hypothetical protein
MMHSCSHYQAHSQLPFAFRQFCREIFQSALLDIRVETVLLLWNWKGMSVPMWRAWSREFELMTEAHAKLSVIRNCSKASLRVCLGEGKQLAGRGLVSSSRGWGEDGGGGGQYTGRENLEQFPTTDS